MPGRRARAGAAVAMRILLVGLPAAAQPDFATWLDELRQEAAARGVSEATLDTALAGVAPIPRVLELDRRQPEVTVPLRRYLAGAVTPARVREGRIRLARHRRLLDEVGGRYGVPPAVIVALWGIETDYGRATGDFPVVGALVTLAHDGRRSGFFREELLAALRILDEGHVAPAAMRGSWAGAMGQSQFMPSSFLRYAVDADGDGHRDIWGSRPDVFASIASYLAQAGWRSGEPWGQRVRLPGGLDGTPAGLGVEKPLGEWRRLGIQRPDGRPVGAGDRLASLVFPQGAGGPAFLVHENTRVLMRWNRSLAFALAAAHLADRIGRSAAGPPRRASRTRAAQHVSTLDAGG